MNGSYLRLYAFAACTSALALAACRGPESAFAPTTNVQSLSSSSAQRQRFTVLFNFDGANGSQPIGLTQVNGSNTLYGITEKGGRDNGGTFFSITPSGNERVRYSFRSAEGEFPNSPPTPLKALFYGLTSNFYCGVAGGPCGIIFSVPLNGHERILHRFRRNRYGRAPHGESAENLTVLNGVLYGTAAGGNKTCVPSGFFTCGMIFSVTTAGDFHIVYYFKGPFPIGKDGAAPDSLVGLNGVLYGTTGYGGSTGNGTFFSLTPDGKERVLYNFQGGSDGMTPVSLTVLDGKLYGTSYGGNSIGVCSYNGLGCGTIFSMTTTGRHRVLYRFQGGSDGWRPQHGLTVLDGKLYGTTQWGGRCVYCGTVFSVTPQGREEILHRFPDGHSVAGYGGSGLTPVGDTLYGTMPGGTRNAGVVFALTP